MSSGLLQRFADRIQPQEDQQPGGDSHQEGHPAPPKLAQDREPEQPQEDRDHADIQPDQGEAQEASVDPARASRTPPGW